MGYNKFKILVSREARVQIAHHVWADCNRTVYGILLGSRYRLLLSLPVESVNVWAEFQRDQFDATYLRIAQKLAASLHLNVLGCYASTDIDAPDFLNCPFLADPFFVKYSKVCCRQCSGERYYTNGKSLPWPSVTIAQGKRLTHLLNQRRIISQWNKLLGRTSYLVTIQK